MATPSSPSGGARVAGIPVPILVVVAAGLLFLYFRSRQTAAPTDLSGTGAAGGTLGGAGGGGSAGGITATGTGTGTFPDDSAWYQAASASLQALGYDALSIQQALTDYLNGQPLSTQEQGLLDIALGHVGPPPTPISVVTAPGGPGPAGTGPGGSGTPPPGGPPPFLVTGTGGVPGIAKFLGGGPAQSVTPIATSPSGAQAPALPIYEWISPGGPGMDPAGTREVTGYPPPPGVPY